PGPPRRARPSNSPQQASVNGQEPSYPARFVLMPGETPSPRAPFPRQGPGLVRTGAISFSVLIRRRGCRSRAALVQGAGRVPRPVADFANRSGRICRRVASYRAMSFFIRTTGTDEQLVIFLSRDTADHVRRRPWTL